MIDQRLSVRIHERLDNFFEYGSAYEFGGVVIDFQSLIYRLEIFTRLKAQQNCSTDKAGSRYSIDPSPTQARPE